MFPPRAKDLRKLWFEWPESLYGRFNFQRAEHIDALVEKLSGNDLPAVVVLGGEPGIGRGYLCDAAAQRARDQGYRVAVWHLDLDGFEPDIENPLTQYLRHLIDQNERQREGVREMTPTLVDLVGKGTQMAGWLVNNPLLELLGQTSQIAASILSLLVQFKNPLSRFANQLSRSAYGSGAPLRDDFDTLHRFLAELTRDRKLLVHVTDGPQLTSDLRRWLIREAERASEHLLLVISCPLGQTTDRVAPEASSEPERLDLQPLNTEELRALLDQRFNPNEFPDDFAALLIRRCQGRPVAIANLLADLMEADLLFSEGEIWRLPPASLNDPGLVAAFSRSLFEEVDEPLATLASTEPELARVLRDLLSLAALCGSYVPMAALLEHLQLDKATAEAAADWVDNVLVSELSWLTDLGFHIAGFQGHGVYAFTHPMLPLVVLDQLSEAAREMRAATLLRFLEHRVQVIRRGWARCFLSIAEHLGDREREPYERSLAWWIGLETADALQSEVRGAIEREEIEPEVVWRIVKHSRAWPAYRRLAVLDAYAQATIGENETSTAVLPFGRLYAFHLLRAGLQRAVGRYSESLADALEALKLASQDQRKQVSALNMSGQARLKLNDLRGAKSDFETALLLTGSNLKEEGLEITLSLQSNLAATLAALGDFDRARNLNQKILDSRERVLGREHPETLTARNNLAYTFQRLDDFEAAGKVHQQNLEILERVLGNDDPRTLQSKYNLAANYKMLGDHERAKTLHEEALAIREQVLGKEHPDTLESMNGLGATLRDMGDLSGATKLLQQATEIGGRMLGNDHPATTHSTWNLLRTVRQLNDSDAEARLIHKLRWLLEVDEGSIPSIDQREIRQLLINFLNPS